jgi:GNAT superfamily N-acetyltransferase
MALTFPQQAEALYQALKPDPYFAALESWVTVGSPREAMLVYYDFSMLEARRFGQLYLPAASSFGVSVWLRPLSAERMARKKAQRSAFLVERFGEAVLDRYGQVMAQMNANAEGLIDEGSWYLSIVGVLPEFQNQGLGTSLITPVLEQSDRAGVSTYLETFTPRNKSFYARLGYEDTGTFAEDVTGAFYSLMIRPAC